MTTTMAKILRHNIAPRLVKQEIERQVVHLKRYQSEGFARLRPPMAPSSFWDEAIKEQHECYSKVRIYKMPKQGYLLCYGDHKWRRQHHGTGPFKTLRQARAWFLDGGR